MKKAFVIIRIQIDNPEQMFEYQAAVPPIIEKYGGKFLVRGGRVKNLEGAPENRRIVVIEFPNMDKAEAFYHSPEYEQARRLRQTSAQADIVVVEGLGD